MPDSVLQDASSGGSSVVTGQIIHPALVNSDTGLPIVILTGDTGTLSWQIVGSFVQMWWKPNTFTDGSITAEGVAFILDPALAPDTGSSFYFGGGSNIESSVYIGRGVVSPGDQGVLFTIDPSGLDTAYQGWSIQYKLLNP